MGWSPGPLEILVIGVVALLIFGSRLPQVMRSFGKGIVEFKKGLKGIEDQVGDATDIGKLTMDDSTDAAPDTNDTYSESQDAYPYPSAEDEVTAETTAETASVEPSGGTEGEVGEQGQAAASTDQQAGEVVSASHQEADPVHAAEQPE